MTVEFLLVRLSLVSVRAPWGHLGASVKGGEENGIKGFGSQGSGVLSHFRHSSSSVLGFIYCISASDFHLNKGFHSFENRKPFFSIAGIFIAIDCSTSKPCFSSQFSIT